MAQEELAITIRGRDMASRALKSIAGRFLSITAAVYALRRAFKAAMTAAIEFNKQLHNVWTLVDKAWAQMQRLGEEVRGLAYKFNVMAAQATKALYQIYSAVFYGAEAFEILEVSIKGAAAGLSDVFTVADMLTTVLNAWGLAASESTRIMDLLFTTIKYGKTTMPELAAQFGRLAGVAAPIGAKIAEMTAAIATLTRQGIATDWAITSLRQTLMQFLRPPAELAKIFTALGYASGSALIHTQGFAKALGLVTEYAAANNIRMEQLFTNVRAVTAVLPLATTAAAGYAADLERMASSAGMAQIAFEKQAEAWSYLLETLRSQINDFAITLGELFVPALVGALKAITLILAPLKEVLKLFNKLGGDYFVAIAAGIGTLTLAVWGLTKAYAALSAVFATTLTMGALSTANIGAQIGALLYRLGRGGMLLGAGKLFGAGLAGAFAVKQIVNFDLELGEVTGIESVKRGIFDSVKAILGGAVAGAIIGGPPGAVVGAIVSGTAVTIRILHEVSVRTAEKAVIAAEAARGVFAAGGALGQLPSILAGAKGLNLFAKSLVEADKELANTQENFQAMIAILKEFYIPIEGWHGFVTEWRLDFENISQDLLDFAQIVGQIGEKALEATPKALKLSEVLKAGTFLEMPPLGLSPIVEQTFANISDALPRVFAPWGAVIENVSTQLIQDQKAWNALVDTLSDSNITTEEAIKTWDDMGIMLDKYSKLAEIAEANGWDLAKALRAFADEMDLVIDGLKEATTAFQQFLAGLTVPTAPAEAAAMVGDILAQARAGTLNLADLIAGGAAVEAIQASLEQARIAAYRMGIDATAIETALAQAADIIGKTPEEIQAALDAVRRAAEQAIREAEAVAREAERARQEAIERFWETTFAPIEAAFLEGRIADLGPMMADLAQRLPELSAAAEGDIDAMEKVLSKKNELYGWIENLISLYKMQGKSTKELEKQLDNLKNALGDGEAAAKSFADRLNAIDLSALASGIAGLVSEVEAAMQAAKTLGERGEAISDLSAIRSEIESQREFFERVFGPGSSFAPEMQTWARTEWNKLMETDIPRLGQTIEEVEKERERAAEAARRAAEKAAREAEQAAREAAQAMQEAFREQFLIPALAGLRTGDWEAAADAIRALAQHRDALIEEAKSLSAANDIRIDEREVLSLIVNAQQELLAALSDQILIMQFAGEDATALEKMKLAVEELFDPLGALKKKIREIAGMLFEAPKAAATALRDMALAIVGRGTAIPALQAGGRISEEGFAYLHAGETVIPAGVQCFGDVCILVEEAAVGVAGALSETQAALNEYMFAQLATTSSCRQCVQSVDAVTVAAQQGISSLEELTAKYPLLEEALMGNAEALKKLLDAAEPGDEIWNLLMETIRDNISRIEQLIDDYRLLGLETRDLEADLAEFGAAIKGTTPLLLRWKQALQGAVDAIRTSFVDLIRGLAGTLFETVSTSFASANLPRGFKLARAAYGIATPGEPWEEPGAGAGFSLSNWAAELAKNLVDALATALAGFLWKDFIVPIVWKDFIVEFLWGKVIKEFLWPSVIKPFIWEPILLPAIKAIADFVLSLISGTASFVGFLSALGGLFVLLTGVGVAIGILTGVIAFLWGAFQGVGDLLSAFFAPIIEAVGWAWEALTPLIDGARALFGALSPIMAIFGEIIAWGIHLVTPLFSALGVVLQLVGGVIRVVADGIKWVWDHTLAPVMNAFAFAIQVIVSPLQWLVDIIKNVCDWFNNLIGTGNMEWVNTGGGEGYWRRIPALQTAPGQWWDVAHTGAAIVHQGETVGRGGGDTYVYNVTLPGVTNAQQFDEELQKIIRRKNLRITGNRIGDLATQGGY